MLCKDEVLQPPKDAGLLSDKQHASMLVPSQVQHLGKVLSGKVLSIKATSFKLLYSSSRESYVRQALVTRA